ncbi:MAG: sodium:solute symporter family protein, partial [Negativicutes bacterium]
LGIGTMLTHDILAPRLDLRDPWAMLRLSRGVVLCVMGAAAFIAIRNLHSEVLLWNYLSMALRGGGIFLPLSLALFWPCRIPPHWGLYSIVLSTGGAVCCSFLPSPPLHPLFIGLLISAGVLAVGAIRQRGKAKGKREPAP